MLKHLLVLPAVCWSCLTFVSLAESGFMLAASALQQSLASCHRSLLLISL
jgi:hypothetical protein